VRFAEGEGFTDRFLFLEDYDMTLAAALVQGVDVWLNTPTRSLEASGTSGMKAALNGGLQLSILDGWWDEAFATDFGWAIGGRDPIADPDPGQRDAGDAGHLYHLLETEVAPRFYAERRTGSAGWAGMMKRSISRIGPVMSAHRMVREYAERYYGPAAGKPTPE
jgi:starch phosphorylase